jgi:hypothetical protein
MRAEDLRDVIATDIPQSPPERAPFEIEHDISRRESWMFAPLIAAIVTLPLLATVLVGVSAWHLASKDASLTSPATVIASRWPEQELPTIR